MVDHYGTSLPSQCLLLKMILSKSFHSLRISTRLWDPKLYLRRALPASVLAAPLRYQIIWSSVLLLIYGRTQLLLKRFENCCVKKEYFILSDLKYYTFFICSPLGADLKCKAKLGRFLERRTQHSKNPLKELCLVQRTMCMTT